MRFVRTGLVALASALVLAACGGGSSSGPEFKKVVVFGDSLADVGTFGFKFTVQKAGDAKGYPIWTQLVSDAVGVPGSAECNAYAATGVASFARNANAACSNFAIGGGRIVTGAAQGGAASPLRVGTQMAANEATGYSLNNLVLIDGGGNDAADLVGAYLGAASGAAGVAAYQAFLGQQLSAATLGSLLPTSGGPERAAAAYMTALADTFYGQVRAQVLDRGARNVVIVNAPDITLTPRFRAVLGGVAASGGAAAATNLQAGIRAWIGAYNARLAELKGNDPRVVIIDFYSLFNQMVTSPASLGLSNAVDPVCPVVGRDSSGLPTYDFPRCSDAALDAQTGKTAGWWRNYVFSDGFHPTPYAHQLMADAVLKAIRTAGWN